MRRSVDGRDEQDGPVVREEKIKQPSGVIGKRIWGMVRLDRRI